MKKEDMQIVCPNCGINCQEGHIKIDTWRMEWAQTYFNPEDGEWCQDKFGDSESGIPPHAELICTACDHAEMLNGEWNPNWGKGDFGWPVEAYPRHISEYNFKVITLELMRRVRRFFWWECFVLPRNKFRRMINWTPPGEGYANE